ncbi:MAG: hypothetical protein JW763_07005 [candidate division Zixibacteria bacterium]|nr:hypothetical protein [candidate division Zixibacteria bacterium]
MSYTNTNLVKRHIRIDDAVAGTYEDYPLVLSGLDWKTLPGRGIRSNSLIIKAVRSVLPTHEEIGFDETAMALSHSRLVRSSVAVASDSSLGTVYVENVDYCIDVGRGVLTRLSDGAIPPDGNVVIWYFYHVPYVEGTDYQVDYNSGRVRRLSGSAIQSDQSVLADFQSALTGEEDEIISAAVAEADAIIDSQIDQALRLGNDQTLQTATTFLAVSLVCRAAAGFVSDGTGSAAQHTTAWLSLAENYRRDYEALMKTLRKSATRLKPPVRS